MDTLKQLRKEVTVLMDTAKDGMVKHHSGGELETRLSNMQRGKYIAYGHIISLIDDKIKENGKK